MLMLARQNIYIYIAYMPVNEALIDLARFSDQLDVLQSDPNTRIMG